MIFDQLGNSPKGIYLLLKKEPFAPIFIGLSAYLTSKNKAKLNLIEVGPQLFPWKD